MPSSHPFQKLCYLSNSGSRPGTLLIACGPYISSFNTKSGSLTTTWPTENDEDNEASGEEGHSRNGVKQPAKKRQKLSTAGDETSQQSSAESVEILAERVKGKRRKSKLLSNKLPDVSHLLATSDGRYVIAITTEDKCIRVLEVKSDGKLKMMSERCMPKRLCAIILTKDEKTIVAGDKFGDVYSLPLFSSEDQADVSLLQDVDATPAFKPSATELTVHTKGNLEALRQQQQQRNFKPKKEAPSFQHKLLLGHVSLLTDIAVAEIDVNKKNRQYILTADRDEHIRVSRGLSQAHIIETYCHGHKDFVSKLCILPWEPRILVAGSGEPSLKVYDWQKGTLFEDNILFSGTARGDIESCLSHIKEERSIEKLTVSGIWTMEELVDDSDSDLKAGGHVLVAIEGLPILLSYYFSEGPTFYHQQTLDFDGNVLDVTVLPQKQTIIVSIDTVHEECSMKVRRTQPLEPRYGIYCYELVDVITAIEHHSDLPRGEKLAREPQWQESDFLRGISIALMRIKDVPILDAEEEIKSQKPSQIYSRLGESLYGLENLRKKRGQEATEGDEEPDDDRNVQVEAEETAE